MKIKKIIKKIIPKEIYYKYSLKIYMNNKTDSYKSIERKLDKRYFKKFNKHINWNEPLTYTEKLNVSKVYGDSIVKSKLTDKYAVRNWVKKKIGNEYLIPLLGVYDSFDEIDFDELPNSFVIKCNHDSGSVTVVKDKKNINLNRLKLKYDYYMKRNYALFGYEMHYNSIEPKIIIEKFMGEAINDYKFLCFNGNVYYCWVDFDRFSHHTRNIYDLDWNLQDFNQGTYQNYNTPVKCPKEFENMKQIAKKLCDGFDQVRIDLYLIEGKIYFGEMTFTNGSGFEKIEPNEWDVKLGKLWYFNSNRDEKINNKINWKIRK